MIHLFFEDVQDIILSKDLLDKWLTRVCVEEGKSLEEVNFIFCSDDYLLNMNQEFLDHDYFTDIITFDYCVDSQVFGDLFISIDRVKDNAVDFSVDFLSELYRVMVHGLLHLCGYKDKSKEEQLVMRSKEDFYLKYIVPRETM